MPSRFHEYKRGEKSAFHPDRGHTRFREIENMEQIVFNISNRVPFGVALLRKAEFSAADDPHSHRLEAAQ